MGRLNLLIEYRNGRKVYAPGDIVDAFVVLNLKKPRKIKKIKVKAVGQSQIKLNHEGKQLRNQEKYFSYLIDVYHGVNTETPVGQHKFPFRFQLTSALPTSFESTLGHVRYSIEAVAEYPGILADKMKCISAFTVLDTVDLNAIPDSRQAQRVFCEKKASGMCCWRKKAVIVNLVTEKSGFVPGEFITMSGIISNERSKPVRNLKVELQQQVTYSGRVKNSHPNTPIIHHTTSNTVASWNMESKVIHGEQTDTWQNETLMQIPPLTPSGLRHCSIIDIKYFLTVTVVVPGSVTNSLIAGKSNSLIIGSMPLQTATPTPIAAATAPPPETEMNAPPPPYDPGNSALMLVPLPSYEEAVTGGASIDQEERSENEEFVSSGSQFIPQYQFYDFSQPAFNPSFHPTAATE